MIIQNPFLQLLLTIAYLAVGLVAILIINRLIEWAEGVISWLKYDSPEWLARGFTGAVIGLGAPMLILWGTNFLIEGHWTTREVGGIGALVGSMLCLVFGFSLMLRCDVQSPT